MSDAPEKPRPARSRSVKISRHEGSPPPVDLLSPIDGLFPPVDDFRRHEVGDEQLAEQRIYGFRKNDPRARAFKLLRSQVIKRVETDGVHLIGITSAAPGAGKSFVASNLAAALARIALADVYLVDLDLHRPALATRFSIEPGPDSPGVHEMLGGIVPDAHRVARLILLTAFRTNVATGELLTGANGDRLFATLRALPPESIVLIDMPPIFADDDAVIIGRRVDGVLLVIEDGYTTAKQARDTIRVLQPTPMIGTVLNRYRNQLLADDYGYGFSYGYGAYY